MAEELRSVQGTALRFRLLGPLEVWAPSRRLNLGGAKPRVLLAHLLLHANKIVQAEQLIDVMWPSGPPRSAAANLQTYVWRLRQRLPASSEDSRLLTERNGYMLVADPEEIDASVFAELTSLAGRLCREGNAAGALDLLGQAESLWRGDPLEDLPANAVWEAELGRLAESRLSVAEERLALQVRLGQEATAIPELRALLTEHPYREGLCQQLMLALHQSGRQAEALQAYADTRDRLVEDLGVEPGESLRRTQLDILRLELRPGAEELRNNGEPEIPVCQLPPAVPDFTGRAFEVQELADALVAPSGSPPMVGVIGAPGTGKSALALHVAHAVREHFPDGQLYVHLGGTAHAPRDPSDVLGELLHALGVTGAALPDSVAARSALFRSRLADRRMLLLLDDAATADQVLSLLPAGKGCGVLLTSRRKLAELPGLHELELDQLPPEEAEQLLARIAGRERIEQEPCAAESILRCCGYLPLAIRIAGARLAGRKAWSLGALHERLADESRRLSELRVGELAVRTSFDLSVRQLPKDAVRAFQLLASLGSPELPGWAVSAVLDRPQADEVLGALVDASLVQVIDADGAGQTRYRMHDLLRCYATELAARGSEQERQAALARALGGWLYLADRAAKGLPVAFGTVTGDVVGWQLDPGVTQSLIADPLAWFARERRALFDAVDAATEAGWDKLAWKLAVVAVPFFDLRSHYDDWRRTHQQALKAVRATGNRTGEAVLLRGLGQVHIYRDAYGDAAEAMARARDLYRESGDQRGEAIALAGVGTVHRVRGEHGVALRVYEQSLAKLASTGDLHSTAQVRSSVGSVHAAEGRRELAREWLTSALRLAAEIGDSHREAVVRVQLGDLHREAGELDSALTLQRPAVTTLEELHDERCSAYAWSSLGRTLLAAGKYGQARSAVDRALGVFRRTGNRRGEAAGLRLLGELHVGRDESRCAGEAWRQALRIWREIGAPDNAGELERELRRLGPA